MHLLTFLTGAALFIASQVDATPVQAIPTFVTPPPPGYTYVTGNPICNVTGFTQIPGNYTETIEQAKNSTVPICLAACKKTKGKCMSIGFSHQYSECLFFDRIVEDTQLTNNTDSGFAHWDLGCSASTYES